MQFRDTDRERQLLLRQAKAIDPSLLIVESTTPPQEYEQNAIYIPNEEKYTVDVASSHSRVSVTYQAPSIELGLHPILLSPGFTAGETSFVQLHKALALHGYPSFSLSHHRQHSERYAIQETHALNDIAVLHDAHMRYGYDHFFALGWSMGAGDVVHMPQYSGLTEHDYIDGVFLFNGMGQVGGDTFPKVAKRMVVAIGRDAQLTQNLPIKHRLTIARAAMDSLKRAATNVRQTKIEAEYASSFDIREIIQQLRSDGLPIYQISSEGDRVFTPIDQIQSTSELDLQRAVLLGPYATHIAGIFVPKTTAHAIDALLDTSQS